MLTEFEELCLTKIKFKSISKYQFLQDIINNILNYCEIYKNLIIKEFSDSISSNFLKYISPFKIKLNKDEIVDNILYSLFDKIPVIDENELRSILIFIKVKKMEFS
jgi:hypothetical protein